MKESFTNLPFLLHNIVLMHVILNKETILIHFVAQHFVNDNVQFKFPTLYQIKDWFFSKISQNNMMYWV